jgi:hypothetical protein
MSADRSDGPGPAVGPATADARPSSRSRFAAPDRVRQPRGSATSAPRRPRSSAEVPDIDKLPARTVIIDGELLRAARLRHRTSQVDLAWDANIGVSTIGRLERRPVVPRMCKDSTLLNLAAALGESPAALVRPDMAAALGLDPVADSPVFFPAAGTRSDAPGQPPSLSA